MKTSIDQALQKTFFTNRENDIHHSTYDEEMLKSQRDKLLKTFHPDNFGDDYYTTRIIKAYEFLLEEVKGEVH